MPEPEIERTPPKVKAELAEAIQTIKALVRAIKAAEDEWGETLMPAGTYYGITFEE